MNERENQPIVPTEEPVSTPPVPEMPEESISAGPEPAVQQVPPPAAPPYAAPEQAAPTPPPGPYGQGYPTQERQTPPPYHMPPQGAYPPPLPRVYYQPPQEKPVPPFNGLAIASMVLGIVSVVLTCLCYGIFSWLTALVGLILGIVACAKGNRSGMVIAGFILNGLALLFALITVAAIVLGTGYQYEYFNSEFLDGVYV